MESIREKQISSFKEAHDITSNTPSRKSYDEIVKSLEVPINIHHNTNYYRSPSISKRFDQPQSFQFSPKAGNYNHHHHHSQSKNASLSYTNTSASSTISSKKSSIRGGGIRSILSPLSPSAMNMNRRLSYSPPPLTKGMNVTIRNRKERGRTNSPKLNNSTTRSDSVATSVLSPLSPLTMKSHATVASAKTKENDHSFLSMNSLKEGLVETGDGDGDGDGDGGDDDEVRKERKSSGVKRSRRSSFFSPSLRRQQRKYPQHRASSISLDPSISENGGDRYDIEKTVDTNSSGRTSVTNSLKIRKKKEKEKQHENQEGDSSKKSSRTRKSSSSSSYRSPTSVFDFTFPSDMTTPTPQTIEEVYHISKRVGGESITIQTSSHINKSTDEELVPSQTITPPSHQNQLGIAGCNLLSLQDVVIPSVVDEHSKKLKMLQAKAQGYKDAEAVRFLALCRSAVITCGTNAAFAVKESREAREIEDLDRIEKEKEDKRMKREQRRLDRQRAKEERRKQKEEARKLALEEARKARDEAKHARTREQERRRRERKKNWPKNKELWREVALLMTDLAQLDKEEKIWNQASVELDQKEAELEERKHHMEMEGTVEEQNMSIDEEEIKVADDSHVQNVVDDITLSANRINDTLQSVFALMDKSDAVRTEIYEKYKKEHKFHGYLGVRNPKTLIRALALG